MDIVSQVSLVVLAIRCVTIVAFQQKIAALLTMEPVAHCDKPEKSDFWDAVCNQRTHAVRVQIILVVEAKTLAVDHTTLAVGQKIHAVGVLTSVAAASTLAVVWQVAPE